MVIHVAMLWTITVILETRLYLNITYTQ